MPERKSSVEPSVMQALHRCVTFRLRVEVVAASFTYTIIWTEKSSAVDSSEPSSETRPARSKVRHHTITPAVQAAMTSEWFKG